MVKRRSRTDPPARPPRSLRFTVDASVFVNAFNPHETGHAASLEILSLIQQRDDPIIVPTLLVTEVASAMAKASDDAAGAFQYAEAISALDNLTLVTLTPALTRQAADLAATHRLRGADAIYVAVARRYGTVLVTRDREQRKRAAAVVDCQTPEQALA